MLVEYTKAPNPAFDAHGLFTELVDKLNEIPDDKQASLNIYSRETGRLWDAYSPIEHLQLYQGSQNVILIDNGWGVYMEVLSEDNEFKLEEIWESE